MPTSDVQSVYGGGGGGVADGNDQAKVSSNDTTTGYLNGKLVAGANISLTENNNGGNETLTIAATVAGGVTGFTPSQNTAAPNATVNASRLLVDATSTNADAVLQPKGTGSLLANLPDSTVTGGNKRGASAVDLQLLRDNANQVAGGYATGILSGRNNRITTLSEESVITGGRGHNIGGAGQAYLSIIGTGNTNTINSLGTNTGILTGLGNTAGGYYGAIAGGQTNTITGWHSFIGSGQLNTASGQYAAIPGGNQNSASGQGAFIGAGYNNQSSGIYSAVLGGSSNVASAARSICLGTYCSAQTSGVKVSTARAFAVTGDCQLQEYILGWQTSDNLQIALNTDELNATTTNANSMTIPNDTTYGFEILVTARRADANDESAAWIIRGCVDNNANTVAFVGTPSVTVLGDDSAGAWQVAAGIDTVNARLQVLVTGQNSKQIRWGAHARVMRVTG